MATPATEDPPPPPPPAALLPSQDADFAAFSASAQSLDHGGEVVTVPEPAPNDTAAAPPPADDAAAATSAAAAAAAAGGGVSQLDANVEKSREELLDKLSVSSPTGKPDAPPVRGRWATPKDFELLKVIGMGAFGKVLQCRNKASGEILAMKVISKRLLRRKTSYVENIQAERDILTKCHHPFIVNMRCSFQTREKVFIVMDFLSGGELFLRLGREGIFRERTAAFYVAEIVLALEHLHNRGVLHRDLKPENILLSKDGHICITDFGLAKDTSEEGFTHEDGRAYTVCGTQEYMAPEMIARKGYDKAADFWSLGCITYEMLAGKPPFETRKGSKELFRMIMNQRVKMPDGASASACKILKGLLNRDTQKRLGAAKSTMFEVGGIAGLKQQPFFDGLDWVKLEKKEIEPPERFEVENDEDLKHFHDEFTKMTIPRSVKEMNKATFKPRHIESDMFKGFSFVHDDFALPDRGDNEEEDYWNSPDSDAYSASECASSALGDDIGEQANAEPLQPAKKKRPPRKKKKKKAAEDAPSVTSDATSQAASQVAKEETAGPASIGEPASVENGEKNSLPVEPTEKERVEAAKATAPTPPVSLRPHRPAHPSPEEKKVMATAPPPTLTLPPAQAPPPKVAKPPAPTWETVKKPVKNPPRSVGNPPPQPVRPVGASGWNSRPPARRQPPPPPFARPMTQSAPQPKPGSWAARALPSQQPPQGSYLRAGASTFQPGTADAGPPSSRRPAAPSSDWRSHSMPISPRHGRKQFSPPQAPPQAEDFPTLGGMKKSASAAAGTPGAWGAKR